MRGELGRQRDGLYHSQDFSKSRIIQEQESKLGTISVRTRLRTSAPNLISEGYEMG